MTRARDNATQGGLVLLTKNVFSGSSLVTINNCFSSTYDNYKLYLNITNATSATGAIRTQLLSGGNVAGSNYNGAFTGLTTGGGANTYNFTSSSTMWLLDCDTANPDISSGDFTIYKPFLAQSTTFTNINMSRYSNNIYTRIGAGYHSTQSSYDGIRFYPDAGTITGTVTIYGIKN